jgi:hypothetical protein
MKSLFDNASDIIRAASATTLGVYVFCILVTSVLVVLLFRHAPLRVQIGAFIATLILMAVVIVLIQKPPPPRPITQEWTHFTTHSTEDIVAVLNRVSPNPHDVVANCTLHGDLHIWYRGGGSGVRYQFASIAWRGEEHPTVNFFYNDGTIVPVGWFSEATGRFGYLEVSGVPVSR